MYPLVEHDLRIFERAQAIHAARLAAMEDARADAPPRGVARPVAMAS